MAAKDVLPPARVLIGRLLELHDLHDKAHDTTARGKLANLRYGLRDRLHSDYPIGRVFPAMSSDTTRYKGDPLTDNPERNEWHTAIAALFGYAHDDVHHTEGVSLGTASRRLYDKMERESLERRFMAMLNSDEEHLPGHLRQTISLLKSESIGLDWHQLLDDVCQWNALGRPVQKRWIRDYYRARRIEETIEAAETVSDTDETEE